MKLYDIIKKHRISDRELISDLENLVNTEYNEGYERAKKENVQNIEEWVRLVDSIRALEK